LKQAADNLYESLVQFDRGRESGEDLRQLIAGTMEKPRDLFRRMEDFISAMLRDLEETREQLGSDSE
jgi:hypothetical protein